MKILEPINPSLLACYFTALTSPVLLIVTLLFGVVKIPSTYVQRVQMLLVGIFSISAITLTAFAAHRTPLPVVQLIRSAELAFLFFIQIIFLGVIPTRLSVIGSVIVTAALSLLLLRAFIEDRLKNHKQISKNNESQLRKVILCVLTR